MTRKQSEESAEAYRQWVYKQNPAARKFLDPDVVATKEKLGHYKGLKKKRKKK